MCCRSEDPQVYNTLAKEKVFSLPEKKELCIFSNKYYQNKNDRSNAVLAASKLKVLSRGRLVKTQADLNETFFFSAFALDKCSIICLL